MPCLNQCFAKQGINLYQFSSIVLFVKSEYGFNLGAPTSFMSFIPASLGVLPAFRWLQGMHALATFSQELAPPLDLGNM